MGVTARAASGLGVPARGAVLATLGVLGVLSMAACSKRAATVGSAPSTLPRSAAPAAPRGSAAAEAARPNLGRTRLPALERLATPTAFDLTASARGALLVWAPAGRHPAALQQLELDATGAARGGVEAVVDASVVTGEVSDLSAAWVGERLAVAWLERQGPKASVRAAWAGVAGAPFELGAAWSGPRLARGNVVVAARGERALVFARGDEAPCIDAGKHGCFAFAFHELEQKRAVPTGLPMSVPVPCTDNSASLVVRGSRFHYGVCTDAGRGPVTTMFSIQRDPEYARADSLLEGCTPAGTFVWHDAAWLVADCEGGRRAARIGDDPPEFLDLHGQRLECTSGKLRVRAPSLDLALEEPRSGLAPLLPPDVAQAGSRAAWTGRVLLVVSSFAEQLQVTVRECRGDRLETATLVPSRPFGAQ